MEMGPEEKKNYEDQMKMWEAMEASDKVTNNRRMKTRSNSNPFARLILTACAIDPLVWVSMRLYSSGAGLSLEIDMSKACCHFDFITIASELVL